MISVVVDLPGVGTMSRWVVISEQWGDRTMVYNDHEGYRCANHTDLDCQHCAVVYRHVQGKGSRKR